MRKINISLHWLILIVSIIISVTILYFTFSYSNNVINKSNEEKIETEYNHLIRNIENFQLDRKAYIAILTNSTNIIKYMSNQSLENETRTKEILARQIKNLTLVMNIRLLSLEGEELIKIDKSNDIFTRKEDLQNKSKREYFKEFLFLKKNEIGISKLELNKEHGKIEKPFRPTLRIAMPVYDKNIKKGLIIINYEMGEWLKQYVKSPFFNLYLINKDGYFIIHKDSKYNWSEFKDNKRDIKKEFNTNIANIKSLTSLTVKELTLWNNNKYYLLYDFKNSNDKKLFINQSKIIGFSTILAILILILPFLKIIYAYIKKLKDSEKKINNILDNSLDCIIMIDKKGIIKTLNNVTLKTFGYTKEELLNKNIRILVPEPHHSKHDSYIKEYDKSLMSKVLTQSRELFGITKNRKLIPISLVISKIHIENELFFIGTIRNIEKEKQTSKLFETAFSQSPLGIALVLDDGSFWRLNDTFCSIVGYTKDELIKLSFQDITHPDDLEIDLNYVQKLLNKELNNYSLEKRYIDKNGNIVWINLSVSPIFLDEDKNKLEYFIAMIEDITEKKIVLEKLLQAEEISLLGHWDWNINEKHIYWSEMMSKIFGKENSSFEPSYETFLSIVHPNDKEMVDKKVQLALNNYSDFNIEFRIVVNGKIKNIRTKGNIIYSNSKNIRMFGTCQDITEIKQLQNKEKKQEHLLMQQSKLASMGEMVAAIAHQWRQPLNSIGLTIQDLLPAYKHNEVDEEYIIDSRDEIMEQLNYMSNTIDEFRNFFNKSNILISFNLIEAIEEIMSLYWAQLKQYNVTLLIKIIKDGVDYNLEELDKEEKKKFIIKNHPSELKQVIINFIGNSKDAIVNIEQRDNIQKEISILIKEEKSSMKISVIDFAGGISNKIQNRMFEPYFTTKKMGTGLGLYISKMIVEKTLYGTIKYENSEKNLPTNTYKGSKFTITLPKDMKRD